MKSSWDGNTPGWDGPSHCLTAQAKVTLYMLIKCFGWLSFFFLSVFIKSILIEMHNTGLSSVGQQLGSLFDRLGNEVQRIKLCWSR